MLVSVTFPICDPSQFCGYCIISSDTFPWIYFVVHRLCLLCQCGLNVVPCSFFDILMRLLAAEPLSTTGLLYLIQYHLWNDLGDSVFDGVGLTGHTPSIDWVNTSLLVWVALSLFVFHCFLFLPPMGCRMFVYKLYLVLMYILSPLWISAFWSSVLVNNINKAASTRGLFSRKVWLPAVERCSSVRKTSKQPVCRHVGCWILYSPTALPEFISSRWVATQLPWGKYVCDCRSQHSGRVEQRSLNHVTFPYPILPKWERKLSHLNSFSLLDTVLRFFFLLYDVCFIMAALKFCSHIHFTKTAEKINIF